MRRTPYHHGDLRTALLDAGAGLLGEVGLARFSVAEVARRVGVSTAAPYRHFADRDALLGAVATRTAVELTGAFSVAAAAAGGDPGARLASVAGAYVRFVAEHGVGFDLVFAEPLRALYDPELASAGRGLIDLLLQLARGVRPTDPHGALVLVERVLAVGQGYATLDTEGFLTGARLTDPGTGTVPSVADRAVAAAAAIVRDGS